MDEIDEKIKELEDKLKKLQLKKEIKTMSFKAWMKKCIKEKGGGNIALSECSNMWKELRKEIREGLEEMQPEDLGKIIIVAHSECDGCKFLKETFTDEIEKGDILYYDEKTAEGKKFIEQYEIKEFPFILYRDNKDTYKVCEIKADGDDISIEC